MALQPLLGHRILGLAPIAQPMHRLRRKPQMPHHRDAAAHHPVDHSQGFRFGALQFHGRRRGFLQHPAGGRHGVVGAALVAEEGQIGDQQGGVAASRHRQTTAHGPAVVQHLLERHRQGGGVTQHHHRQGIAHEHRIGPRFGHDRRREGIPGGEHADRQAGLLALQQVMRALGHGGVAGWRVSIVAAGRWLSRQPALLS
ncbi:hypothetical protein LBMAG41_14590 [Cyanobium sp.]|nr:hypothetical protein LBMAG41_14590 [Cyanobium sp.]